MSAHRVAAITRRVLQQLRRDRRTLALLFIAPLLILTLFYYMLRGGGSPPAVGVVNLDQGPMGATVAAQLEASKTVTATAMDEPTAQRRLRDGSLAGYVVLPAGFTANALRGAIQPDIHLEGSDPSQSGAVIQATLQAMAGAAQSALSGVSLSLRVEPNVTYLHGGPSLGTLDYFAGAFVGFVVFFLVFVITCVSFLRERSQGTLERLMASPLRRAEVVAGYMLGFLVLALAQATEVLLFSLLVLRVYNAGNVLLVFLMEVLLALTAVNLGIFFSMFARTELQAVQFIPLVIVPQALLSGLIVPVASEPGWLQAISNVLPLTYAAEGLHDIMLKGAGLDWGRVQLDLVVMLAFAIAAMLAAATTLRRRVA